VSGASVGCVHAGPKPVDELKRRRCAELLGQGDLGDAEACRAVGVSDGAAYKLLRQSEVQTGLRAL
jgi:hypothetical protein